MARVAWLVGSESVREPLPHLVLAFSGAKARSHETIPEVILGPETGRIGWG